EIVVALFGDAHDLLDLRLGLEHEVLRAAAAEDEHAARVPGRLGFVDNGRGLVHIVVHVDAQLGTPQGHRGDIHADGTVARTSGEDRNAALVSRGDEGTVLQPKLFATSVY